MCWRLKNSRVHISGVIAFDAFLTWIKVRKCGDCRRNALLLTVKLADLYPLAYLTVRNIHTTQGDNFTKRGRFHR